MDKMKRNLEFKNAAETPQQQLLSGESHGDLKETIEISDDEDAATIVSMANAENEVVREVVATVESANGSTKEKEIVQTSAGSLKDNESPCVLIQTLRQPKNLTQARNAYTCDHCSKKCGSKIQVSQHSKIHRNKKFVRLQQPIDLEKSNKAKMVLEKKVQQIYMKQKLTPLEPRSGISHKFETSLHRHTRKQKQPIKCRQSIWMKDVRCFQKSVNTLGEHLIPLLPFARIARELLRKHARWSDVKTTKRALMALKESSEMYLTYKYEDSNRLILQAKKALEERNRVRKARKVNK